MSLPGTATALAGIGQEDAPGLDGRRAHRGARARGRHGAPDRHPASRSRTPSAWTWRSAARPTPRCTSPPSPTPPRWTSRSPTSTGSAARRRSSRLLEPAGETVMEDLEFAGGIPAVLKNLEPLLNKDCLTVSGRTIGEIVAKVAARRRRRSSARSTTRSPPKAASPCSRARSRPTARWSSRAPIAAGMMSFTGTARVFESEDAAMDLPARGQGGRRRTSSSSATKARRAARACASRWP